MSRRKEMRVIDDNTEIIFIISPYMHIVCIASDEMIVPTSHDFI